MSKRFRMISLLAEALEIEIEECQKKDQEYEEQFRKDFADVNSFLVGKLIEQKSNEKPANNEPWTERLKEAKPNIVKKLYRALARKTHPDISDHDENEFSDIQKAYSENDLTTLLSAANRYNVNADLTYEEAELLKDRIEEQRQKSKEVKKTVRWMWAQSDKSTSMREKVIISMGVDPQEFSTWLENSKKH